ncbi:MAG: hypothetical protein IJP03_01105 [Christensenellaceae bacterium]|nr:hypothetical protein [Christensenellaceae bacterium]
MAKTMKALTAVFLVLTGVFAALHAWLGAAVFQPLAITAGTFFYHLAMRLAVGSLVDAVMKNSADPQARWFVLKGWEEKLYRALKVKRWKAKMPTYAPENFDLKTRTPLEVAGAMCQAEVVHEVIIPLSFVPVAFIGLFGAPAVFIATSLLAAAYDGLFVVLQRYNRPRVLRLALRQQKNDR